MSVGKVLSSLRGGHVYVEDNFNRADQTGLGTTSDGKLEWYMVPSDSYYSAFTFVPFNIVSNKAVKSSASGSTSMNSAMLDVGTPNVDVTVTINGTSSSLAEKLLMLRCKTSGADQFSSGVWVAHSGGTLYVWEWDAGNRYTTAFVSQAASTTTTLRVVLEGTSCKVYADGTLRVTTTLTKGNMGTAVGFGWAEYGSQSINFEDLIIRSP